MRLIDKVAQGAMEHHATDARGINHILPGPGQFAQRLKDCSLRYILDREASRQCAALFRSSECLPDPLDPLSRPPARSFWLEFYTDGEADAPFCHQNGAKMGILAEFAEDERSGSLSCFREHPSDQTGEYLQFAIEFDFSENGLALPRSLSALRIRQQDLPEVDRLLGHTRMVFTDQWVRWAERGVAPFGAHVADVAGLAWCAAPMTTCFSALLNSQSAFHKVGSSLARINHARAGRRQPQLLDHIEVRLDLAAIRAASGDMAGAGPGRQVPRLHLVRGHSVRRHGKTFWRTSHFRGDAGDPLIRTVSVTSSARGRGVEQGSSN